VLGRFDKLWEGKGMGELCVDSKLCYGDGIKGGKLKEWGMVFLQQSV